MKNKELISKMTLEEKASLLSGKDFWQTKDLPAHGVPAIFLADGPHGLRKQVAAADHIGLNESIKSTCFPTSATVANSWDAALAEDIGKCLGVEAAAQKVNVVLGPGLNIKRNPLCGRNFEYYSEDPYLAGKMAAAAVRGIQSSGVSACLKHFAVNSQEERRMVIDSVLDERTLREIYLTAFEIALKEGGVKTIMSSYNPVNGIYANENEHLLVDILRKEWGFDGVVVTDWGGNNDRVAALKVGNELEMPTTGGETNREIVEAVRDGRIEERCVDEAADRLLTLIFDTVKATEKSPENKEDYSAAHHETARRGAEGSIVLLKNNEGVLPLKKEARIAVIGDFAKIPRYQGAGSSIVNPSKLDVPLEALSGAGLNVVGYAQGFKRYGKKSKGLIKRALKTALYADTILLYAGLDEMSEAEGMERANMRLPENQLMLISELSALAKREKKKLVVMLLCGSAIEMSWTDGADAVLHCSLGGQAGASAAVNVLTGKVNPSGKLSESYPLKYGDVPNAKMFPAKLMTAEYREGPFIGYRYYDTASIPVKYPFGFGLSYTTFEYSDISLSGSGVSFRLKNTGKVAGAEVAQMYIGRTNSKVYRPKKELKGFTKVFLEPGEERTVTIYFDDYTFRFFCVEKNEWCIESGDYDIMIGASVSDIRLSVGYTAEGADFTVEKTEKILPSYFSGRIENVGDGEFRALLGKEIPDPNYKFIKKKRIEVTANTAISELKYARGWTGRFFAGGLKFAYSFLKAIGKRKRANVIMMGVYHMPVRGLSRMTGGMISWGQLQGLLTMFNGKFFKGFGLFLKEGRAKKRRKKELKQSEKINKGIETMSEISLNANKTLTDSKASPQDNLNTEVDRSLAADAKANKASAASVSQSEIAATVTAGEKVLTPSSNPFVRFGRWCAGIWRKFKAKHPNVAQFIVFFILSNGVTVLQMAMMPLFQLIFNQTSLVDVNLQFGRIGNNFDGTPYYMFNYAAGKIDANGYGGGLAYFLSVQITLGIAQVINFFAQRKITFKANNNPWRAAMWYVIAYIAITFVAAAAQGLYKAPIYKLFMTTWGMGNGGKIFADVITMIINSAISFWVFFPIFKLIFKQKKGETAK